MTENQLLFRKQSVDYSSGRLKGDVLAKPRVSHILFSIAATLWVAVLSYAMANFSYQKPFIVEALTFTENNKTLATVYISKDAIKGNYADQYFPARVKGNSENWSHEIRLQPDKINDIDSNKIFTEQSLLSSKGITAALFINPNSLQRFDINDGTILEVHIGQIDVNLLETLFPRGQP